jgi:ubiquinone/menaquinone biosynthesis C-methylase UbiE
LGGKVMDKWISEMAPNLEGSFYEKEAIRYIEKASVLGTEPVHDLLRIISSFNVYYGKEAIEKSNADPVPLIIKLLDENTEFLQIASQNFNDLNLSHPRDEFDTVEHATGEHYGELFSEFDEYHYFEEPYELLLRRFERNNVPVSDFKGKKALDAGCGGGRYTIALKKLGFAEVVGVDISEVGLETCRKRLVEKGIGGVLYKEGNVLELPFGDATFDFVFSNGVLHHTKDMVKGIHELLRVLKPMGQGFLYLIETPGGLYWDVIEILRCVLRKVDFSYARTVFNLLGVPGNRRFFILDHIMAPINIRSTSEQIEGILKDAGSKNIRRLTRGTDFDRIEKIYNKVPYSDIKYGVGENRYFFDKS